MTENKKLKRDLVLQSFAPLFLLLCIKHAHCYWKYLGIAYDWNSLINHPYFYDVIVFVFSSLWVLWSIFVYLGFTGITENNCDSYGEQIEILEERRDCGVNFLVTFVLPLLVDDIDNPQGLVAYVLLLFLMMRLLVNTNLFYQNPILTLFGYKTFEFKFLNPHKDINKPNSVYIGITKGLDIKDKAYVKRKYISDNVFIVFNV